MFGGVEILNEYYGSSNGQIGKDFSLPEIQVSKFLSKIQFSIKCT